MYLTCDFSTGSCYNSISVMPKSENGVTSISRHMFEQFKLKYLKITKIGILFCMAILYQY